MTECCRTSSVSRTESIRGNDHRHMINLVKSSVIDPTAGINGYVPKTKDILSVAYE
jgi:hypothetical protein